MRLVFRWRFWFLSALALLLVACKPFASFEVSPEVVKVGVEATFDASASSASPTPRGNVVVSYAWEFGDGSSGTGKIAKHSYTQAGNYVVKLRVTDKAGRISHTSQTLKVINNDTEPKTASIKVMAQIPGGVALSGVEVRVGSNTAETGANGVAELTEIPVGDDRVIQARKTGYVAQALQTVVAADTDDQQVLIVLLPEKDTLEITAIEAEQTLSSNYLNASVALPANAMVTLAGTPATGTATLRLTPWDIASIDLQAMPGNGRALSEDGSLLDLLSASMMTVEFFDAAGNKLQVASGKTATIQMDLPAGTTHIGGNPIAEGAVIPLWNFDEARGLWIREGTGAVVSTTTGFAIRATVNHFSTWSASYGLTVLSVVPSRPSNPTGTVTPVRCTDPSGNAVACQVTVKATWPDNSFRFWSASIPAATRYFLNLPSNAELQWQARTSTGLMGALSAAGPGREVIIGVQSPTSSNHVQCRLPDTTPVICSASVSTSSGEGLAPMYLPVDGATVVTSLNTSAGPLNWIGSYQGRMPGETTRRTYRGTTTSGPTGQVVIALELVETPPTDTHFFVRCAPNSIGNTNHGSVPLTQCSVFIEVFEGSTRVEALSLSGLGDGAAVSFPLRPNANLRITAEGQLLSSTTSLRPVAYFQSPLNTIAYGQLIELELAAFYMF